MVGLLPLSGGTLLLQECVEHTLRKDQKITKNTKNICLKDKKEKKQINNAGFW